VSLPDACRMLGGNLRQRNQLKCNALPERRRCRRLLRAPARMCAPSVISPVDGIKISHARSFNIRHLRRSGIYKYFNNLDCRRLLFMLRQCSGNEFMSFFPWGRV